LEVIGATAFEPATLLYDTAYTADVVLLDEAGLARDNTQIVNAGGPSAAVEHYWVQNAFYPRDRWRIVPDTSGYLIFSARHSTSGLDTRVVAIGARSRCADIDVRGRHLTIGARLRPGALSALTAIPAHELTDRSVPLAELATAVNRALVDRLSAVSPEEALGQMVLVLESWIRQRGATMAPRLGRLLTNCGSVTQAAALTGMQTRTLYREVLDVVGLGPKRALRIGRLHRALAFAAVRRSWAAAATAAGYADQAHLTREMQDLLGESPTEWTRRGRADLFKTPFPR
jgi:AraC-like DNA-binding protein